ncbi:MAG: STAS domain-containing protein [Gemmatimonadales bacterium]
MTEERTLAAPEELGLETQQEFRRSAVALLQALPENARLTIDMSRTRSIDSTGLNALILIRRSATERRQIVRLEGVGEELRYALARTKLDGLLSSESP